MSDVTASVLVHIEKASIRDISESEINKKVDEIINKAELVNSEDKVKLLLNAITYLDLTSLKGGETFEDIKELCQKAANVIDVNLQWKNPIHTAAVCVFPASACDAIKALKDLNVRDKIEVASVAGDFPAAALPLKQRIDEVKQVVEYGVDEIDIVISRKLALEHKWKELYDELTLMKEACGKAKMKTILATGDLPGLKEVYIASIVAMLAGSDFIKTSTGKEIVNATLPVGVVMCKAIKDYYVTHQRKVGLKPAGGIKTSEDTLQWMKLIEKELGNEWLSKDLFRIGASSVLDNIIKTVHALK
ncbi:deoxyribose-phosphate aldolase [Phymastichus coffea]|uniref:deoxyribose-phosphate aldolase n=1 Tax=Phymastichus coffea TaxID=108790 RepID=UPI00273CF3DF|nr:deoxyribose-phosphate aldolase [Phymastichus coffea]